MIYLKRSILFERVWFFICIRKTTFITIKLQTMRKNEIYLVTFETQFIPRVSKSNRKEEIINKYKDLYWLVSTTETTSNSW